MPDEIARSAPHAGDEHHDCADRDLADRETADRKIAYRDGERCSHPPIVAIGNRTSMLDEPGARTTAAAPVSVALGPMRARRYTTVRRNRCRVPPSGPRSSISAATNPNDS